MNRRLIGAFCALSFLLPLGGCWSSSEIQSVTYAKAIGLDFQDGIYHVYVQALDFGSVAKSDTSGKANSTPGIWVGHGQGKTMNLAYNDLFQSAQLHIAWGHVTAAVLSEALLNSGKIRDAVDTVNRFPESRYTAWVYGTRMPINKLFTITSLFNLSPLDSILHNPIPSYREESLLPPIRSMSYFANQHEDSAITYLPSLAYNDKAWNMNDKPHDLLFIEGAFFNRDDEKHGYMPKSQLLGFSMMQPQMRRAPLLLEENGEPIGTIGIGMPKIKIKPIVRGDNVRFRIKVFLHGTLYEYLSPMPYNEMAKLTAKTAKEKILATYQAALKQGIDVYELENRLYRQHPQLWKKLTNNGKEDFLTESSIESLDVRVRIIYTGKYKRIAS